MSTTFQNSAMVLSIGVFFSLMITGLAATLPQTLSAGLTAHGVSATDASRVAGLPPVSVLFASLLGYNPVQSLLGSSTLQSLPPADAAYLTGRGFFPTLISGPFAQGLSVAFGFAIIVCLIAALASALRGGRYIYTEPVSKSVATRPETVAVVVSEHTQSLWPIDPNPVEPEQEISDNHSLGVALPTKENLGSEIVKGTDGK